MLFGIPCNKENKNMKKISLKGLWKVLAAAGKDFMRNKVFKMSASLAYYTIFSLGPMLIVMIFFANLFFKREAIEGSLYEQIKGLIGPNSAEQVQSIIKSAALSNNSTVTAIVGFIALLIGATSVFSDMQDSINSIWNLKVKPSKDNWMKMVIDRLLSFSVVVALGFLLLVSLVINSVMDGLMNKLTTMFPDMAVILAYILNVTITLVVTSFLFAIIFKVLPDALIRWSDVFIGAVCTAIFFMLGKFLISFYIGSTDVGSSYGAAGSIVILMLWVYFSSLILFFGAEFTKAFAMKYGNAIRPSKYAVTTQMTEVETTGKTVQQNEKEAIKTEEQLQKKEDAE
jgi:membrane protein